MPREFYVFLQQVADASNTANGIDLTDVNNRLSALESEGVGSIGPVIGLTSVHVDGFLPGYVSLSLENDTDAPTSTQYYGSDTTGARGWFNVSDTLAASGNVTLTVGTDGVTTFDLSSGVLASLSLADSAVQPGDLATVATTGAYSDLSGLPTLGTAAATDATAYATAAQGTKADSAVQSIVAGTGVTVDTTDPQNPVVSAPGAGAAIPAGYIDGLQMQWVSGTALTVSSGAAYIEGTGAVLSASAAIAKTGLVLTASTWYHVYLYDNAGTPDVEIVTTSPAAPYNGTARSKAADTSRRYMGSVRTDSSGNLIEFDNIAVWLRYRHPVPSTAVLAAGSATTDTLVSCSSYIPITSRMGGFRAVNAGTVALYFAPGSVSGVTSNYYAAFTGGSSITCNFDMPVDSSQRVVYANANTGGSAYLQVTGYMVQR